MNRRSLLRMLGLAPVAACSAVLPATAQPKPDDVKGVATVKLELDTTELRQLMDDIARDQALMFGYGAPSYADGGVVR